MNGFHGTTVHIKGNKPSPWMWITLCVALVSIGQCTMHESEQKAEKAERLDAWLATPEHSFRFCITTAAGVNGTATPAQIEACNKAAGR